MGNCMRSTSKHSDASKENHSELNKKNVQNHDVIILKLRNQRDRLLAQKRSMEKNSEKAAQEAKEHIRLKQKQQAMFSIRRKKLYDDMLNQVADRYAIIDKTILEVENNVQLKEFTKVLEEGNNLIKELDVAMQLEKIKDVAQDMKEREQNANEFNKMFEEHHLNDQDIANLYSQFEAEMDESVVLSGKASQKKQEPNANIISSQKLVAKNKNNMEVEEDEEQQEIQKKLMALA